MVLALIFYHSFSAFLLIVFYMSDTVLESEDVAVNKTLLSWKRGQIMIQVNEQNIIHIIINAWKKTKQDNVTRVKRAKLTRKPIESV